MFKFAKKSLIFVILMSFALILPTTMSDIISANADGVAEIAMELESGTVLHCKNEKAKLPMASTTKIMTALLICEDCNLEEQFTVPDEAVGVEGSSIYLKRDEVVTVKDMLYGLMLRSGNDAACALAIYHSGSVDKFVKKMNDKAQAIGAKDTHFSNPSGLPDKEHFTTASDLCNIARYALKNQTFAEVVRTKNYTGTFRSFTNKNKILSLVEGANGVKTGYTEKAGRCLVSSAKRENMDVVCVVLNCYDMYERSAGIINDCFENFSVENISGDKIFSFNGVLCRLKEGASICVNKLLPCEYKIVPVSQDDHDDAVAQLEIYSSNNLIFSAFLYSINGN